ERVRPSPRGDRGGPRHRARRDARALLCTHAHQPARAHVGAAMSAEDPGAGHRSVDLERVSRGHYRLRNERGGSMVIGDGSGEEFTPVELLLAAIAGCSSVDVDLITSRRAEPEEFT